ncbi:MAG TPA: UDP-N-acetylmuramoyl-tripeptide--D-alanyl-D-alanine ligase [Chloroflexota bacterium]|nr:UDP-N-acetylmuramoyl-tripeptide--D-alanyl-D-alanine ligase [Chloroflexota bacterium]
MSTILSIIAACLLVFAWGRPLVLLGLRSLHILQLEEYQTGRFWRWLSEHARAAFDWPLLASVALVAAGALSGATPVWSILWLGSLAVGVRQSWRTKAIEAKKPLVLTARARRLLTGWIICEVIVGVGVARSVEIAAVATNVPILAGAAIGLLAAGLLCWPLVSLANLLLYPVEAGFRSYYLRSARAILRRHAPIVIGVAGSYGKTSTKTILSQILATRYPTLATPRSFNTPMGLCRVIREQLQPEHRFFIAELGAYQRGEIRQLAQLVKPTIGVLTAVGPEHLERFGSMDNVKKAEFEVVEALPSDGLAIFNGDDVICRELALGSHCRWLLAGGPPTERRQLWAEDVALTPAGLEFTLCSVEGRQDKVTTALLGRHNVANILCAGCAALTCGLSFDDLVAAIPRLVPIEHRLQLVSNDNGVVVIDDTYNSNPRGAAAAIETLATFQGGRRFLVTPGMVELAALQEAAHRDFGRQAASVCDGVILVGPRQTRAIAEGLIETGFAKERLFVTRNLAEATEQLKTLLRPGDAVLFENDLPDNYAE